MYKIKSGKKNLCHFSFDGKMVIYFHETKFSEFYSVQQAEGFIADYFDYPINKDVCLGDLKFDIQEAS